MPSSTQLKLAIHYLGLRFSIAEDAYSTQPAMNGAGSVAELQLRIYWDEKINKAYLN